MVILKRHRKLLDEAKVQIPGGRFPNGPAMPKHGQTQNRDPQSGQYAFDGDQSRMCVCGHRLGVHIAGGWDCINGDPCPGATGEHCDCTKFRQSRKKT